MTPIENRSEAADEGMSKLVGALLVELANEVPDRPGFESVRADLLAASKVYEDGKKKDLVLRFYLAMRSVFHELKRLEKLEAARVKEAAGQTADAGHGVVYQTESSQTFSSQ
jgi:hypothetical protein